MIGVHFQENHVASGFGNHLARPIFRDEWKEDLTLEEGILLLEKCFRVLLYRDRSAVNKIQVGASCPPYANAGWMSWVFFFASSS